MPLLSQFKAARTIFFLQKNIITFLIILFKVANSSYHRHIYIDALLSAGLYVATILKETALPCELLQVNGVNFMKLLLQSAINYCLSLTHSHKCGIYSGNRQETKTTSVTFSYHYKCQLLFICSVYRSAPNHRMGYYNVLRVLTAANVCNAVTVMIHDC